MISITLFCAVFYVLGILTWWVLCGYRDLQSLSELAAGLIWPLIAIMLGCFSVGEWLQTRRSSRPED